MWLAAVQPWAVIFQFAFHKDEDRYLISDELFPMRFTVSCRFGIQPLKPAVTQALGQSDRSFSEEEAEGPAQHPRPAHTSMPLPERTSSSFFSTSSFLLASALCCAYDSGEKTSN
ncbi:uncharacterized [Tachysurus ichikawai]